MTAFLFRSLSLHSRVGRTRISTASPTTAFASNRQTSAVSARLSRQADSKGRSGVTIVELLIVLAVISLLVSLAAPSVMQAREAARNAQCKARLKELALAAHGHHEQYGRFPRASAH